MSPLKENTNTQSGSSLPDLAKVGVGIVGLLYVVGFLVVTFRLSQFGVHPVTWLGKLRRPNEEGKSNS